MLSRLGLTSRSQRIILSLIAIGLTGLIVLLQDDRQAAAPAANAASQANGGQQAGSQTVGGRQAEVEVARTDDAKASQRREAIAKAVRWLKSQEGGPHGGHTIARHVGRTDAEMRERIDREGKSIVSGFYDLETAAAAIVRTIRHKPNDDRVRRWLGDDSSKRRLALRRQFNKAVGRIVYRDKPARDGRTVVAVLTKRREGGGYSLLTAYVEP